MITVVTAIIIAKVILGIGVVFTFVLFVIAWGDARCNAVIGEEPKPEVTGVIFDAYYGTMKRTVYIRYISWLVYFIIMFYIAGAIQNTIVIVFAMVAPFLSIYVIDWTHTKLLRYEKQKYIKRSGAR